MNQHLKLVFTVVLLAVTTSASAEIPSDGLLDDVTAKFLEQSATWGVVITRFATWLFWVLATISMVWTFGIMALRQADIGEFFAEFVRFTLTTGFFWWLLSNGPAIAMAIINSLRQIGAEAGHVSRLLQPSTPISIGFDVVRKAFTGLSWAHPVDNLAIVVISAVVVLCMAVIAANVLIALVTAWTMAFAGVFILGFGGARWTSDMAIAYFKAMLGIGLELLTVTLLLGVAVSVIDGFHSRVNAHSVYELLLVMCVCAVLALLIDKIPARVAALAGGGSGASVGASTVMAAAAMGAAAASGIGAAAAAGAAGAAGGAQALMAAVSKASAAESGGSGSMGPAGGADGSVGGDSGGAAAHNSGTSSLASAMGDSGSNSQTSGTSGSPASSHAPASSNSGSQAGSSQGSAKQSSAIAKAGGAAAKVGKVAMGTAANLAQGSWEVAKNNLADRVANTTGGRIAGAISGSEQLTGIHNAPQSFGGDSLSAGTDSADHASEIAAFRDRTSA